MTEMSAEMSAEVAMRPFRMVALAAEPDVAGLVVAEGVEFPDGQVAVRSFFDSRSEFSVFPHMSFAAIIQDAVPFWISPDDPEPIAEFQILAKGLPVEVGTRFRDGSVALWHFFGKSIQFGNDVNSMAGQLEVRWLTCGGRAQ